MQLIWLDIYHNLPNKYVCTYINIQYLPKSRCCAFLVPAVATCPTRWPGIALPTRRRLTGFTGWCGGASEQSQNHQEMTAALEAAGPKVLHSVE